MHVLHEAKYTILIPEPSAIPSNTPSDAHVCALHFKFKVTSPYCATTL